jgi:hypothetical protein
MNAVADPPAIAASEKAPIGSSGHMRAQSAQPAKTTMTIAARTRGFGRGGNIMSRFYA